MAPVQLSFIWCRPPPSVRPKRGGSSVDGDIQAPNAMEPCMYHQYRKDRSLRRKGAHFEDRPRTMTTHGTCTWYQRPLPELLKNVPPPHLILLSTFYICTVIVQKLKAPLRLLYLVLFSWMKAKALVPSNANQTWTIRASFFLNERLLCYARWITSCKVFKMYFLCIRNNLLPARKVWCHFWGCHEMRAHNVFCTKRSA